MSNAWMFVVCLAAMSARGVSHAEDIPIVIPEQDRSALIHFSHQQHLVDFGLKCTDCHTKAPGSSAASENILPRESDCATCHAAEIEDPAQCGKCHKQDTPAAFENPERVIRFTHDFHISNAGLGCEDCHVGMARTDYASRSNWPVMDDCLTCHTEHEAPKDCDTCHPRVESLRPHTHLPDWIHEHARHGRTGDMPCAKCHSDAWCADCHAGAMLAEAEAPGDRFATAAPPVRGRVAQTLQRQHELNYRFIHPLDAVGKERTCATCHAQEFCVDCHRVSGDENRFKPVWHGPLPDDPVPWVLPGVGSGGGRHGQWARRDIERCVACHDVDADDPSCVQCHVDLDGVRGTDPATHPARFADRIGEGAFHENPGSLCFTCHVNTNASGAGFCGYCHL